MTWRTARQGAQGGSQWDGGFGARWAGGAPSQKYHPQHTPHPTRGPNRFQNRTNALLQKLLNTLGQDNTNNNKEEAKDPANRTSQWVCHECGTSHWNNKLVRCRSCRASRPQGNPEGLAPRTGATAPAAQYGTKVSSPKLPNAPSNASKFAPWPKRYPLLPAWKG